MSLVDKPSSSVEIFYSYSHKDEKLRNKLETHLSVMKREGVISTWYDRKISAGKEWAGEIDEHINSAQVIILLVSADFLASDYCYDIEMRRALERHNLGEAHVIPIILRPCDWHNALFGKLEALPVNGKPITSRDWHNQDEAFLNIARGIKNVIEELKENIETKIAIKKFDNPWEKNILVVDNEIEILDFIKIILEDEGYNVFCASNEKEALEIAQNLQINLFLLDHLLSGQTGFEVLDKLRAMGKNAPVIMITSSSVYKKAFNRGVVDYIQKPFDIEELVARVKARIM